MKINWLATAILIALIILLIYNINSRRDYGEAIGKLKGIIEEKDIKLSEKSEAYEADKKAHEKKIAELDGAITSANAVICELEQKDIEKGTKIEELEKDYKNLETDLEKIDNLQEQVGSWKSRFSIAQEEIAEKDKIIFSLQAKYNNELNLRLGCENLLKNLRQSQTIRDTLISELEKKLRHRQRSSTLERGVGIAVIACLAYAALN